MKYGTIDHFQTGVAIPVSALRSKQSCGIGEYPDLLLLGNWARSCSMNVIQILPINDTGEEASPYSALSAFALNPNYLRLADLPGFKSVEEEYFQFRLEQSSSAKIDYLACYRFKRQALHKMYSSVFSSVSKDKTFLKWIEKHRWVKPFAVYSFLKEQNNLASWHDWENYQNPTLARIDSIWAKKWEDCLFFAWVQYEAENQLKNVTQQLDSIQIRLKGDIPILLNEDSADVWAFRKYFSLSKRAGAPPDMFCEKGQNWKFPTYDWETLKKENYSWWKERLQQASHYYHAFRIDHVLGFFRIWQIDQAEESGLLGVLTPSIPIQHKELLQAGWTDTDIQEALRPGYFSQQINLPPDLISNHFQESNGKLYPLAQSESEILALPISQDEKNTLLELYSQRILLDPQKTKEYYPYWFWKESIASQSLSLDKKQALDSLLANQQQEPLWADHGEALLDMIRKETDMLVCAEDLGVVPHCVAPTLEKLDILSLKIERWARNYETDNSLIPTEQYPRLSVCSPSCHDTSTLRGLWEEQDFNREEYAQSVQWQGAIPEHFSTDMARAMIDRNLNANSLMTILPLQDWLSLFYNLRTETPEEERINTPGTMSPNNWSWKMLPWLEDLCDYKEFHSYVKSMVERRQNRKIQ